jgi:putative two-component system response regulator
LIQIRRQERDDARDATILALAKLAEHRDPETGAHLERVQCYCRLVSESMALRPRYAAVITREFIEAIVRSCPLHDVGKVGIPDRILLKPGKLDPGEFEIMKTHARIGGDTIRALVEQGRRQSFLQMGMEIAYNHHERYDGTGYPQGLAGQAIPLPARILALADVYDALTSRRVYKPPMTHSQASAIILAGRGQHFDPDVVAAFVEQAAEFERLARALAEPAPPMPEDVEIGLRA